MQATISLKNDGYIVTDRGTTKKLYTIRRPSFKTGIYQLVNAHKYKLYTLHREQFTGKPVFVISNNGMPIIKASCEAMFLDPKISITGRSTNGEEVNYTLASKDRKNFDILHGETVCGHINTHMTVSNELQYDMECDDKYFDDYVAFFPVIIDMSFSQLNK